MAEKDIFEASFKKLEKIVAELEDGKLTLDESLKKYEEGVRLARECSKMLESAQKKAEMLIKKEGKLTAEKIEDDYEEEEAK
ncbi:MAG: exodeoxyribonuclease VII small subunit [Candidatus Omnitrophica bacterium]|nr:exodeoxyribonuclease VII small subunit [Candidatus Omnitrophota bacterium]